jgi:hypothetical protein
MGTLLRLLLTALGYDVFVRDHLCEVSKTIDSIPAIKQKKWFWGGMLHLFPVAFVLILLFLLRSAEIKHTKREVFALLLASLWAWLGPVLIWYYERFTVPYFVRKCKRIITDIGQYNIIRDKAYSNIMSLKFTRVFVPVWIVLVSIAFIRASAFISGYGIRGINDYFWWIIFLGVALMAYYTSLGFCFTYKTILLTMLVGKSKLDSNIYHQDGVFGLSFIGDFAFKTAMMFFSGWLFAPLMILSGSSYGSSIDDLRSMRLLLLIMYTVYTIASFMIPIYIIHDKSLREKSNRASSYLLLANRLAKALEVRLSEPQLKKFEFCKRMIEDIRLMPSWPLRLDTGLKFMITSIVVPILAAVLTAFLKTYAGGASAHVP